MAASQYLAKYLNMRVVFILISMCLEIMKIAKDHLALVKVFEDMGFEIVGTKNINNEILYLVKKKRSSKI